MVQKSKKNDQKLKTRGPALNQKLLKRESTLGEAQRKLNERMTWWWIWMGVYHKATELILKEKSL